MTCAPRAVFFDAGGTLLHPHPTVGETYARVARRHGARLDPLQTQKAFNAAFRRHSSERMVHPASEASERQFWRRVVLETVGGPGRVRDFDHYLGDLYDVMGRAESWRLYPDSLPALEALHRLSVPMALVSNWDRRLLATIEGLGLSCFFRVVSISSLCGCSKPDPRIFRMTCRRIGLPPARVLHVGDTLRDDVHGALEAGLQAALIQRRSWKPLPGVRCLGSLLDLLTLVRGL